MQPGQEGSLRGFVPFPADSLWNKDISSAPVDPNSAALINFIGPTVGLHADFGSGEFDGSIIGIPYQVVDSTQAPVTINFTEFGDESDPGPMPIPLNAPIEGDPNPSGDQHVLILDNANCWLYELYDASAERFGVERRFVRGLGPHSRRAAPLHLDFRGRRGPADFSGPRALRRNCRGRYQSRPAVHAAEKHRRVHAARITLGRESTNANAAPMGMRLRLKSSFDISSYSATNQVLLNAMKKYGLIMADNGSNMYISGAPDSRWDNDDLHNLGGVTASDFEVIRMTPIYTQASCPQAHRR